MTRPNYVFFFRKSFCSFIKTRIYKFAFPIHNMAVRDLGLTTSKVPTLVYILILVIGLMEREVEKR